jgi:hypothetical protein
MTVAILSLSRVIRHSAFAAGTIGGLSGWYPKGAGRWSRAPFGSWAEETALGSGAQRHGSYGTIFWRIGTDE